MKIISINNKADLLVHEKSIEQLFLECFGDRLSLDLWRWAYISNPNGEPIVSLCFDEDLLVGHYAAIPMPLSRRSEILNSYLSMTTMVAASHRKHGVFVKLAEDTYRNALNRNVDIVMGFPNEMSTPGFRKRLNWDLPESDVVVSLSKDELLKASEKFKLVNDDSYMFDLSNDRIRNWRLSKPSVEYVWNDGLAYKIFEDQIDLVYLKKIDSLNYLPENKKINLLVSSEMKDLMKYRKFNYQFGGISINKVFFPETINRQMALSDVF